MQHKGQANLTQLLPNPDNKTKGRLLKMASRQKIKLGRDASMLMKSLVKLATLILAFSGKTLNFLSK